MGTALKTQGRGGVSLENLRANNKQRKAEQIKNDIIIIKIKSTGRSSIYCTLLMCKIKIKICTISDMFLLYLVMLN